MNAKPQSSTPAHISASTSTLALPPQLASFVKQLQALLATAPAEPVVLQQGGALLQQLIASDDWLAQDATHPHPDHYQQYLLYVDPEERFSVVSFVWGPSQGTPIHNHTVWGLIGMLRGAEESQNYGQDAQGHWLPEGAPHLLQSGDVQAVSPSIGDVHRVRNAVDGQVSISIHVYGADIGKVQRQVFFEDGSSKPFVSGYASRST